MRVEQDIITTKGHHQDIITTKGHQQDIITTKGHQQDIIATKAAQGKRIKFVKDRENKEIGSLF